MMKKFITFPYWMLFIVCFSRGYLHAEVTDVSVKYGNNVNNLDTETTNQNTQLNSLNVYANNYDATTNNQRQFPSISDGDFRASHKLPEVEHNFKPLQNTQSSKMYSAAQQEQHYDTKKVVEMVQPVMNFGLAPMVHYMPQVSNDNGVRYMQLIAARPILLPIRQILAPNVAYTTPSPVNSANNYIDYAVQPIPLINAVPVNGPQVPQKKPVVVDVSLKQGSGTFGLLTYASGLTNYKPNLRINRDIKDKALPSNLSLNVNEYIPLMSTKNVVPFLIRGRL